MVASWDMGFGEDFKKKLKEIGWFVAIGLLRWLIEYLTRDNPGEDQGDAEGKHE